MANRDPVELRWGARLASESTLTHFEYISVAIALIFALIVGRLVGAIPVALESHRRYWIHVGWIAIMLQAVVLQWWAIWSLKSLDWTPLRFFWVLLVPATVLVRAIVLVGHRPDSVTSFRDHFYDNRVRFFAIGLLTSVEIGLSPWVYGNEPQGGSPSHIQAGLVALVSLIGMAFAQPRIQAALMVGAFAIALTGFFVVFD